MKPKGDIQWRSAGVSFCFLGVVERPLLGEWDVNFQDRVCWEGHCRRWRQLEGQPDGKRDEHPSASLISCVSTILSSFLFIWLHWVFVAHGLSLVVVHRLSCPKACGILVPQPGMEPASSALEGGFLTTGLPGKSFYNTFRLHSLLTTCALFLPGHHHGPSPSSICNELLTGFPVSALDPTIPSLHRIKGSVGWMWITPCPSSANPLLHAAFLLTHRVKSSPWFTCPALLSLTALAAGLWLPPTSHALSSHTGIALLLLSWSWHGQFLLVIDTLPSVLPLQCPSLQREGFSNHAG